MRQLGVNKALNYGRSCKLSFVRFDLGSPIFDEVADRPGEFRDLCFLVPINLQNRRSVIYLRFISWLKTEGLNFTTREKSYRQHVHVWTKMGVRKEVIRSGLYSIWRTWIDACKSGFYCHHDFRCRLLLWLTPNHKSTRKLLLLHYTVSLSLLILAIISIFLYSSFCKSYQQLPSTFDRTLNGQSILMNSLKSTIVIMW